MALLASSVCLGVEKIVRIKNPLPYAHIADGASVTVSGDMLGARSKNGQQKWQVDYPKVRVELYFFEVLLGGSDVDMSFPVETTANGAWAHSMTFNQYGGQEWPYLISAVALDAFNSADWNTEDWIYVSIE